MNRITEQLAAALRACIAPTPSEGFAETVDGAANLTALAWIERAFGTLAEMDNGDASPLGDALDDLARGLRRLRQQRPVLAAFDAAQQDTARAHAGGHTAEPWRVSEDCLTVWGLPQSGASDRACVADAYADARRIVACVNACAGIPTERLEKLGLGVFEHCVAGWYGENL